MKIVSWNVNGLKACIKKGGFEGIPGLAPDVVCLQEIKTKSPVAILDGYEHFYNPAERERYSGTLTMTKEPPEGTAYGMGRPKLDDEGRVLAVDMGGLYVVNTYVPNSQGSLERKDYRVKWDREYIKFLRKLDKEKPLIACGDFNVTMSFDDTYKENMREYWAEQGFDSDERSALKDLQKKGFTDAFRHLYPDKNESYTWWSYRRYKRNDNRGWRLDYFLISDRLLPQVADVIHHDEITGSDHCPIELVLR